ncbi:MAG: hypothetical protein ABWX92_07050 [Mycetocola sp.]
MRTIEVDERDSTWERDDPRFRLYVFKGADNAVTTLDILNATIEEALETAIALSHGDKHLWSLALVEQDARGMRGLIWLSGMDYNDPPGTAREWQHRRQMQNRYLAARGRAGEAPVLPNGLRLIRVFPEWVAGWPLWESFTDAYRLTGPDLRLSQSLSDELYQWNESWLRRGEDDPVPDGWRERGLELVHQLQGEMAGVAEVRPEFLG